jgi:seryl-tRNA synthetase
MIDPKLIAENPKLVEENNKRRGKKIKVSTAKDLLASRAKLIGVVEKLRAEGNEVASKIPKADKKEKEKMIAEGKRIKEAVKEVELRLAAAEEALALELRTYPNILREDVPTGEDESKNKELRKVGKPPKFSFKPKDHLELGEALGILDMERAAKVAGGRFAYLKGDAVLLEFALIQYALSTLLAKNFVPVVPPHLISTKAMAAMGYLDHGGEEEVYHLKNDDLVLIGTSEQAIGPMLMDEMLPEGKLPLRFVGISPCYRRESGSYGKDVRGILRVHQFDKVEMFSFTTPEMSDEEHELLLSLQEQLMKGLKLPYRVVKLCSGDTGVPSARTYDIETWMPSQDRYRETHSTSNTTDFQTRRLNVRYKEGKKTQLAHALNGTAFAIGRTLIAILENYQQEDGSVVVPEVLRPWIGKDVMHS